MTHHILVLHIFLKGRNPIRDFQFSQCFIMPLRLVLVGSSPGEIKPRVY